MKNERVVPGEVGVGVMTNRHEFVTMLRTQVNAGKDIPREQVVGMLEVIEDFIKLRAADVKRANRIKRSLRQLDAFTGGLTKVSTQIRDITERLQNDADEPDEL